MSLAEPYYLENTRDIVFLAVFTVPARALLVS